MANNRLSIPQIESELRMIDRSLGVRIGKVTDIYSPINRTAALEVYDKRSTYNDDKYVHYELPVCHVNARNGIVYDDRYPGSTEHKRALDIVKQWDRKLPN